MVDHEPARSEGALGSADGGLGDLAMRSALAALVAAAGVIHLAMVASHWNEWALEGAAMAAAGWIQLALAAAIVLRPSRGVLVGTVVASLVFTGVWALSRTSGYPFGPHADEAESVTAVDATVVVLELLAIVGVVVVLAWPGLTVGGRGPRWAVPVLATATLIAVTTAVLASPSAADHAHDEHDHDTEVAATPVADHDHGDEPVAAADDDRTDEPSPTADHDHGDEPVAAEGDDLGLSLLTNGHQHDSGEVELDLATQLQLYGQLAATLELVDLYPTVADAEAAGFRRAGPFSPGLGTHYLPPDGYYNLDGLMDPEDLRWPTLIFDGVEPGSPLAGFMYTAVGSEEEPEGFVGPNDHWHYHTNVCIVFGPDGVEAPLGADRSATQEQCDRYGGVLIDNTGYMVHVWTVPGYESSRGIFSEVNPAITCPDGTYYTRPEEDIGLVTTTCLSET